jgi:hypothetical protein
MARGGPEVRRQPLAAPGERRIQGLSPLLDLQGEGLPQPKGVHELRIRFFITLIIPAIAMTSCRAPAPPVSMPQPTAASIVPYLKSAEYPLDLSPTGSIRLENGLYEGPPAAPGSATKLTVRLGEMLASGDINGDGTEDTAMILRADPGGSGTFFYLAVVLNEQGKPRAAASVFIGDRIQVQSLHIERGMIKVAFLDHGPAQPLASPPTVQSEQTYEYRDGTLGPAP